MAFVKEKQPEGMFAGKFTARTRTFESYVGNVNRSLVWIFAAALAMPPDASVAELPDTPLGSGCQTLGSLNGSLVWCELNYLFFS